MTREYISTTPISERSDRMQRKIYHHLNCLKRGKFTVWLRHRMAWDDEVNRAVAEIFVPPPKTPLQSYMESLHDLMKKHFASKVKQQFETASLFWENWK